MCTNWQTKQNDLWEMFHKTTGPDVGLGHVVVKYHNAKKKKKKSKVLKFFDVNRCSLSLSLTE